MSSMVANPKFSVPAVSTTKSKIAILQHNNENEKEFLQSVLAYCQRTDTTYLLDVLAGPVTAP